MQGLTEVVPVSSSAHLVLVPWLLGRPPSPDRTLLASALHAGSCAGMAVAWRRELTALTTTDRRTALLLAAASVPAAVAGLTFSGPVERRLGRPPQLAVLLAAAGVALRLADRTPVRTLRVGPREAAVAAAAQVAALVPGVSRSGAVLTGLRAAGVEPREAERFAALLSLPVSAGAAALSLATAGRARRRQARGLLAVGLPVAAVTSAVCADALRRRGGPSTKAVTLYRLALAATVAVRLAVSAAKGRA